MPRSLIKWFVPLHYLVLRFDSGGSSTPDNSGMNEAAKMNADIAKEMWEEYQKTYLPMEQGFAADAAGFDTPMQRNKAASDAVATVGRSFDLQRDATARDMAAMGVNPVSGKWAAMERDSDLAEAAAKAGAANTAREGVKNMGWARKQDAISVGKGMPGTASSALAQSGNLYGQSAKLAADANAADSAAIGNTVAGGIAAYGLGKDWGWFRDGGYVTRKPRRRFAGGGLMRMNPRMQAVLPHVSSGVISSGAQQPNPMHQAVGLARMVKNGSRMANTLADTELAHGLAVPGVSAGSEQAAMLAAQDKGFGVRGLMATRDAASTATDAVAAEMSTPAALSAAETATSAAAAAETTAAALTAAEVLAPEAMAALFLLKDGGGVDVTDGGAVRGPGTETSDSIPAKLSDNEFVLNADAVKLVGTEVLDRINNAGLQVRYGNHGTGAAGLQRIEQPGGGRVIDGEAVRVEEGTEPKLASGGFLNALGGVGAGLVAGSELERRRKADKRESERLQLARNADERAQGMHDVQLKSAQDAQAEADAARGLLQEWASARQSAAGGDFAPVMKEIDSYNQQQGAYNDGNFIVPQSTKDGTVINRISPDGKVSGSIPLNPQTAVQALDAGYKQRLKFISPTYYQHYEAAEQQAREKAADRESQEKIAGGHDATSRDVAAGNNATSVRVAGIHEGGANARNAATLGLEREKLDQSKRQLVSGENGTFVVDLGKGDRAPGLTRLEGIQPKRDADKQLSAVKEARSQLETGLGITRDPMDRMLSPGSADMGIYNDVTAAMDSAIRNGMTASQAGALGRKVHDMAVKLKAAGSSNPVGDAINRLNGATAAPSQPAPAQQGKTADYSSLWK